MKFDEQLAEYLYENKNLTLEGLGTFTLNEQVRVPNEQEKEVYYPIEGLSFTYNSRSITDENIIFFLVKKLHKIEPLIRSDVESYLSNIRILLNIGSPYTIHGIGTLNKNNQGIPEFTPGRFLPAKEELNPVRENAAHNYPVRSRSSAGKTVATILIIISAIAALGGLGWSIFNFSAKTPASDTSTDAREPANTTVQNTETITTKKDSETLHTVVTPTPGVSSAVAAKNMAIAGNSVTYKMVFEVTKSKERAHGRTAQLNNLHSYAQYDSIPINDSIAYYRLFLTMKINPADTTRVKDSLQTFFGKKIFVEQNHD